VKYLGWLCKGKASFYIVAILIVIAWILIGQMFQVSAFEDVVVNKTIVPENHSITSPYQGYGEAIFDSGLLWLVNQDNPLPTGYSPNNLVSHDGIQLQAPAHTAFKEMLDAMKSDNIWGLKLASAYRSYEYQYNLFSTKVTGLVANGMNHEEATLAAAQILQPPGASEHQTGLALDVTVAGDLTSDFGKTTAGIWIAKNAHRFGFIIRYPYAKTEITQITYEPWHLRYVSVPHAEIIMENNLTLEEYAGFIAGLEGYIVWDNDKDSRVYYIVVFSDVWVESIDREVVSISSVSYGDASGYIITLRGVYRNYSNSP